MTLVTEGGMEMSREEKKKWLYEHKDRIKLNFNCGGIDCSNCPFTGTICGVNKEMNDLLLEVFAEEHGYIKRPAIDFIIPDKFYKPLNPINPDHYKSGKLQTIEQMIIVFGPSKVANFCEVNAFKYHARAGLKGDASLDHKKADWYMRLYDLLKVFGCMDGKKALKALREFLKEEEEENDRLRNKHERDHRECAG